MWQTQYCEYEGYWDVDQVKWASGQESAVKYGY